MQQLEKLHAQENEEQQLKLQLDQQQQDADDDAQPQRKAQERDAEAVGNDAVAQRDAAVQEEDVDKLLHPSFFKIS